MSEVTGSRQAAVWAGIFWGFLFFRVHHIGHLQILSYQWMPFVAVALVRFLRYPTLRWGLAFALFFVLQALVSCSPWDTLHPGRCNPALRRSA